MATRMLQRRATAAEWAAENPILSSGEIGFETDTKVLKIGDGVTHWNDLDLPYMPLSGGTMTGPLNLVAPTADNHGVRQIDLNSKLTGLQQIVKYSSSGTFIKGNYPWLRAVRVYAIGAGGGARGSDVANSGGAGGGGGEYAESFILASALASSETVTVGAGGAGGVNGNYGSHGGNSSFGTHVIANGGETAGWISGAHGGRGGFGGTGQITIPGGAGQSSGDPVLYTTSGIYPGGSGGNSGAGGGGGSASPARAANRNGDAGGIGGGGGGGYNRNAGTLSGGAGGNGLVVVELYA